MDQQRSTQQEHVVTIRPDTDPSLTSSNAETFRSSNSSSQGVPTDASTSFANTEGSSARQRASPLNSGRWISIELTNTIAQILLAIIVLSLSRDEHPEAALQILVITYAAGCLATFPMLYWRYTHRYVRSSEQNPLPQASSSSASPSSAATANIPQSPPTPQSEVSRTEGSDGQDSVDSGRLGVVAERYKIMLDCFFASWFVVGSVWVFGGHSSASETSHLYRLCIFFLALSCIGYALPFLLCTALCCCLPCIIALFGFREYSKRPRGASADAISALPTYKFKAKAPNIKDESESDSDSGGDGGVVAPGTDKERQVSAEDAVCCICLSKYGDDVELRELPCTHHFHVECVDKWLKINASCPLCKHGVGEAPSDGNTAAEPVDQHTPTAIGSQGPVN
jgi:hypothetical protein